MKAYLQYATDEIWPRVGRIVRGFELWLALASGIYMAVFADHTVFSRVRVGDTAVGVVTYAAIGFGFCLAGLTISMTLPDAEFARTLATPDAGGQSKDAFSDLFFVFSWTAVVHWATLTLGLIVVPLLGSDSPLVVIGASAQRRTLLGVVAGVVVYALLQFLITVITLAQVGRVYIAHLQKKP